MAISLAFSRLCLNSVARTLTKPPQLLFHSTPVLCAEPMKKRKRLDPAIVRMREERRKRKIEKQIRRLEKNARQLKPIDELEVPIEYINEKEIRIRVIEPITFEETERRALLQKEWARYKKHQSIEEYKIIIRQMKAQEKALNELRLESEELYQAAIQLDNDLIPFKAEGPVVTPPIDKYVSPAEYLPIAYEYTFVNELLF